jgi:hypothetical protein
MIFTIGLIAQGKNEPPSFPVGVLVGNKSDEMRLIVEKWLDERFGTTAWEVNKFGKLVWTNNENEDPFVVATIHVIRVSTTGEIDGFEWFDRTLWLPSRLGND